MESDSWTRFSTASRRHQSALLSRYDLYLGIEDVDGGDEEPRAEFPCPFCSEDFDIVGLCCHIDDEHQVEAKNGMSPVVGENVVPAPSNNSMAAGIAKLSGKKRAECWDHFDLIMKQDGKKRARCKYCPKLYLCDPKRNGTTSFNAHMQVCKAHPHNKALSPMPIL